jgi:hypothetical protein
MMAQVYKMAVEEEVEESAGIPRQLARKLLHNWVIFVVNVGHLCSNVGHFCNNDA